VLNQKNEEKDFQLDFCKIGGLEIDRVPFGFLLLLSLLLLMTMGSSLSLWVEFVRKKHLQKKYEEKRVRVMSQKRSKATEQ